MFVTDKILDFWVEQLIKVRNNLILYFFISIVFSIAGKGFLIITVIALNAFLRDNFLLTSRYRKGMLDLYHRIYKENNYDNEKKIKKLLSIKAYFFFKFPFYKDYSPIYLYLKYFLFISYFMSKDYEKAYEVVNELDLFVEKYIIKKNKEIEKENERIKKENAKRKRWKRKKMVDYLPNIDYPRDYTKEEINGKGLLSYLENEEDEYAIKLKELFLQKKKYYEREGK